MSIGRSPAKVSEKPRAIATAGLATLVEAVNPLGLAWLVAGGLLYTAGVYFFLKRDLRFAHFVWHLFVMGGSLCHVLAVIFGVLRG